MCNIKSYFLCQQGTATPSSFNFSKLFLFFLIALPPFLFSLLSPHPGDTPPLSLSLFIADVSARMMRPLRLKEILYLTISRGANIEAVAIM